LRSTLHGAPSGDPEQRCSAQRWIVVIGTPARDPGQQRTGRGRRDQREGADLATNWPWLKPGPTDVGDVDPEPRFGGRLERIRIARCPGRYGRVACESHGARGGSLREPPARWSLRCPQAQGICGRSTSRSKRH